MKNCKIIACCIIGFFLLFNLNFCCAENWISISEPFGLLEEESLGIWELVSHNSRWTKCESYIYNIQWFHYQEPLITGFAGGVDGYFIVNLGFEKQTYPKYKPNVETFFNEEDWRVRLEEIQFNEPSKWSIPK